MPDLAIGTEQAVGARAEKVATRKMSGQDPPPTMFGS